MCQTSIMSSRPHFEPLMKSYIKPASSLPHALVMWIHPALIQPFYLSFQGLHDSINILEGSDVNSTTFKSFTPSHPPARKHKSSFVSVSTCLALHVPRCFVALCAHLFKRLPFSLHLSLSFSPSLPCPLTFPLVICFFSLLWDLGSHSLRAHCSALIHSSGWAPRGRMGALVSAFSLSLPPPLAAPLLAPCHTMMSWLLFASGCPLILSPCCTLPIFSPFTPLTLHPILLFSVFQSESLSQILLPLKRHQRDLGMFGCCLAHPRYMLYTQIGNLSAPPNSHFNLTGLNPAFTLTHPFSVISFYFSLGFQASLVAFSLWSSH